ncbi:MAG: hypothetical protein ABI577_12155 [bacterium]
MKAPTIASSTQCGNYTNSSAASFPAEQGAVTGSPATNTVALVCPALTIVKTANPVGPVNLGSNVGFDLTVTNTSTVAATGVSVSDTLPSIAGIVWSTATANCNVAAGVLSCSNLNVAANSGTTVIHVTGTTSGVTTRAACTTITNDNATAVVFGVTSTSGSASVTINCPSVTIAKVANPAGPVNAGASIGWTFTVTNTTSVVANNVSVSDGLPSATGVTWNATATNTGGGTCGVAANVLSCTNLTVPANGSVIVAVTGSTTASGADKTCGVITNTGATATLLGTISDQLASASVTVNCPDPGVAKSGNGPVTAGDDLVFTVTVTAGGTGTQSVVLSDVMPGTGLTWTKGSPDSSACTPAGPLSSGSQYTCTFNTLSPGDVRTVTFTAPSNPSMCAQQPLSNTATIAPADGSSDVNGANNSATATITVNCPNVTLTKLADNPKTVSAGDNIGFTITATNNGVGAAKGFVLTDTLPANVTWTINPANASCQISAGVLRCPTGAGTTTLAPGASISVHIVGVTTPAACGTVTNTASAVVTNQVNAIPNASDSVTVSCPDISVVKTADNGTINAGETAAFTLVVTNTGAGIAKGATLSDTLPGGITWSEDSGDCSIAAGVLSCTFGDLAPAATRTIHVTGLTAKANCGLLANTASVNATNEPAAATANNSSTANIGVNCADISVVKVADASPVNATDGIGFTITAKNNGVGTAKGVTVNDTLPNTAGLAWTESPDNGECTIVGFQLTCNFGDLVQNQTKSVHVVSPTTVASCGTVNNTAGVTTTNDGTGSSGAAVVVNCPNVTVAKTKIQGQADPVSAGDTIAFQIVVTVGGNGTAYNVTASDTFPTNTSQWVVTNDPTAPLACGVVVNQLSCSFGNVATPKSFTITVTGKAIAANGNVTCGTITNTATVAAGNESNTQDNTSSATVGVNCPSVTIAKTASNSPISAGDLAKFKVTVSNTGAGTATGVAVSDTLPESGNLSWALDPAVPGCAIVAGVLTCSGSGFAAMAPGSTVDIFVSATTAPAVCGVLNNYAYVSVANDNVAGQTQSNLAMITVNCPDITVSKVADKSPISAGDLASFTIKVTNSAATGTAYGVTLTDNLPASAIGWTDDSAKCTIDGAGKLECTIGDMAPLAIFTVTVTGTTTPAQCGNLPNTVTVAATNEAEAAKANNSSSATIVVNCPDLKVEKSPDGGAISAGEDAVFTIVLSNIGAGTAHDVTLSDPLPGGLTWGVDNSDCEITAATLDCDFGELAADGKITVTLTAPTNPEQCVELPNTASATASNEASSALANNEDSGSITVACPDVDVVKTAVDDPINPGEDAKFTITITNAGPGDAVHVVLTDVLPAGLTWSVDDALCEITAGSLKCAYKQIDAGDKVVIGLSAPTTTTQCGLISNTATLTVENEPESAAGDNTSTDTILVACGSIQVVKIDQVAGSDPERPATWNFNITGPNGFNEARAIALGGGSVTITNVPLGVGYGVAEVQAKAGACPVPNETGTYRTTGPAGTQDLETAGETISFVFTNAECGIVLSTGTLVVNKVSDLDGDGVQDPGEPGLSGWPITVTGPQFPGGQLFATGINGQLVLPGILTGAYTVSEGSQSSYQSIGVLTDDNAPIFTASTSTSITLDFGDTDIVTFFNQPRGSITAHKTTQILFGAQVQQATQDNDGWRITLDSVTCGIHTSKLTDGSGNATFTNLPICSDYVVAEDLSLPGAPGYSPLTPASVVGQTPGQSQATQVSFTNQRVVVLCADCSTIPTPTPTAAPSATPTAPSTSTPVPPTATSPASTPTPVSTTAGERTPGPGSPTPVAPNTGAGWANGQVGGANMFLFLIGLLAVAGGMATVAFGRRSRQR